MLRTDLTHPPLLEALARCGHGSKVLIADGNYPLAEKSGNASKIYLGLTSGIPDVMQVLRVIHSVCPLEKAEVMVPEEGSEPEIFAEFREELPEAVLQGLKRQEFYQACAAEDVTVAISTGEKRTFSNILLTVGCV